MGEKKHVFNQLPSVLAVLVAENRAYTYVDKLGYAPTRDLALFYIREAMRDLHSLLNQGRWESERAREEALRINWDYVEAEIAQIVSAEDLPTLREYLSVIVSKALARAARLSYPERSGQKEGASG